MDALDQFLRQQFGDEIGAEVSQWVPFALLAIGLFLAIMLISRMASGRKRRKQLANARLAVMDVAEVDQRRRLVLLRRDDVEHLVMIGGPADIVIETGIGTPEPQPQTIVMQGAPVADVPRAVPLPPKPSASTSSAPSPEPVSRSVSKPTALEEPKRTEVSDTEKSTGARSAGIETSAAKSNGPDAPETPKVEPTLPRPSDAAPAKRAEPTLDADPPSGAGKSVSEPTMRPRSEPRVWPPSTATKVDDVTVDSPNPDDVPTANNAKGASGEDDMAAEMDALLDRFERTRR